MSDKLVESTVGMRRRTRGGGTAVLIVLAVALLGTWGGWTASAGIVDSHVLRFEATPGLINLNRTTSIEVEVGTTYGPGLDNYRVTATAPGGSTASAWYNFTSVPQTLGRVLGNASADFMTAVDQAGTYDLRLEHWDGVTFSLAAMSELRTTSQLNVVLVIRTSSDPFSGTHTCPVANEIVRGAKFLGGGYVYYVTGEAVTSANSDALGNVTGSFLGITRPMKAPPLWHQAWKVPWNAPTGAQRFWMNASDGRGNFGSAVSGTAPFRPVTIIPDVLEVATSLMNATGGETVTFAPGESLSLEVDVTYNDKNAHETVDDPTPADPYNGPLTTARGGQVKAHLGWGAFNATTSMFANTLTNLTLTFDVATSKWVATYTIPAGTQNLTAVQALITASDGATAPNTGTAFSTQFAIKTPPAPVTVEVPRDIFRSTGFELPVVAGLAILLLIVGLGVGMTLSRRRRGGSPPEGKAKGKEPESDDEWEETK